MVIDGTEETAALYTRVVRAYNDMYDRYNGDFHSMAIAMEQEAIAGEKEYTKWQESLRVAAREQVQNAMAYINKEVDTIERGYLENAIMEQIMAGDGDATNLSRDDIVAAGDSA